MSKPFNTSGDGLSLYPVHTGNYEQWLQDVPGIQRKWLQASGFRAQPGELCSLPGVNGELHGYVFGMQDDGWLYQLAALPAKLAAGSYQLVAD